MQTLKSLLSYNCENNVFVVMEQMDVETAFIWFSKVMSIYKSTASL